MWVFTCINNYEKLVLRINAYVIKCIINTLLYRVVCPELF